MASPFEYGKREVGREGARFAGEMLAGLLGGTGAEIAGAIGKKAGSVATNLGTTAATRLGASPEVAARVGKYSPAAGLGLAALGYIASQMGDGGGSEQERIAAMRGANQIAGVDQKLQADLVRQQGYAAMNEQKFAHQMALIQARADAMTPRNQPVPGGSGNLNYALNTANQIFGGTPSY
jgi:hypothetical protein